MSKFLVENTRVVVKGLLHSAAYVGGHGLIIAGGAVSLVGTSVLGTAASVAAAVGLGVAVQSGMNLRKTIMQIHQNHAKEIQEFGTREEKDCLDQAQQTLETNTPIFKKSVRATYIAGAFAGVAIAAFAPVGFAVLSGAVVTTAYHFAVGASQRKELSQQITAARDEVKDLAQAIRERRTPTSGTPRQSLGM